MSTIPKLVAGLRDAAQIIFENLDTDRFNMIFNDLESSADTFSLSDLKTKLQILRAQIKTFPLDRATKLELSNQLKLLAGKLASSHSLLEEPLRIQNLNSSLDYVDPPSLSAIQIRKRPDEFEKPTEHAPIRVPRTLATVEINEDLVEAEERWHNTDEVKVAEFFGDLPPPSDEERLLPPGFTEDPSNSSQQKALEAQTLGAYFAEGDAMNSSPKKRNEDRARDTTRLLLNFSLLGLVAIIAICTVRMSTFQDTLSYIRAQKLVHLSSEPRISLTESLSEVPVLVANVAEQSPIETEIDETVTAVIDFITAIEEEPATRGEELTKTLTTVVVYVPQPVEQVPLLQTAVSEPGAPTKVRIKPSSDDQPVRCDGEFAYSNLLWQNGHWWGLRDVECNNGLYTITVGAYKGETIRSSCLNAETNGTPWCRLIERF